jgi:hypothetical protein
VISTEGGEVRFHKPVVYQPVAALYERRGGTAVGDRRYNEEGDTKDVLDGRYVLAANNEVRFEVSAYDKTRPLTIDPVLSYSTYLGGTGDEFAFGIAVDSSGNAYVTGNTNSTDFPTASPIQAAFGGTAEIFVTKLNAAGSALVYSTYLGGSGVDQGVGIAVDSSGNAYVTGLTLSSDFPTTPGAFDTTCGTDGTCDGGIGDAFVAKISPTLFGPIPYLS